jgi:hypothetical protein
MADDDLGSFFAEINQIEETVKSDGSEFDKSASQSKSESLNAPPPLSVPVPVAYTTQSISKPAMKSVEPAVETTNHPVYTYEYSQFEIPAPQIEPTFQSPYPPTSHPSAPLIPRQEKGTFVNLIYSQYETYKIFFCTFRFRPYGCW